MRRCWHDVCKTRVLLRKILVATTTVVAVHDVRLVVAFDMVHKSCCFRRTGAPRQVCENGSGDDRRKHDAKCFRGLHETDQNAGETPRIMQQAAPAGAKLDSALVRHARVGSGAEIPRVAQKKLGEVSGETLCAPPNKDKERWRE